MTVYSKVKFNDVTFDVSGDVDEYEVGNVTIELEGHDVTECVISQIEQKACDALCEAYPEAMVAKAERDWESYEDR